MAGEKRKTMDIPSCSSAEGQEGPAKKRKSPPDFENLSTEMVIITVEGKAFTVHKDLICYYSPFFAAAFNGSFIEGQTRSMTIEDTTKAAFALFIGWIYSGKIVDTAVEFTEAQGKTYELAILADRFLIPELQNAAIEKIYVNGRKFNKIMTTCVKRVYLNTLAGSALRKITTTLIGRCMTADSFFKKVSDYSNSLPTEFLADMVIELRKANNGGNPLKFTEVDIKQYMVEVPEDSETAAGTKMT